MPEKTGKIVIAAANGFIGQSLINYFSNYEIIGLVRNPESGIRNSKSKESNHQIIKWDGKTHESWAHHLEGALAIINLAGKSVNCRYNEKNKAAIFSSRLDSTQAIGNAINSCKNPPAVWLNAGSATIYRHSTDQPMTEMGGEYHNDFSVQVCKAWEKKFDESQTPRTRKVFLRIAIVLGKNGGVYKTLRRLTKLGLGGKHGKGKQMVSWIHEQDLCRAIDFLIHKNELDGVFNCAAPHPVPNHEFMLTLRKSLGVPIGLPQPEFLLKLGTWVMRTEKELVLKSRYVIPERLYINGFEFTYPTIDFAFDELAKKTNSAF